MTFLWMLIASYCGVFLSLRAGKRWGEWAEFIGVLLLCAVFGAVAGITSQPEILGGVFGLLSGYGTMKLLWRQRDDL